MYDINSTGFRKAANTLFFKTVSERITTALYKKFTMEPFSKSESEIYEWMGEWPGMSEWLSDRQIKNMAKNLYTLANRDWESTVGFTKTKLEDNPEMIKTLIPGMADAAVDHPTSLLFEAIADNGLAYDGQPFFDNAHTYWKDDDTEGTYDNLLTGTGTTVAQITTDFDSVIAQFQGFVKRNGEPIFQDIGKITILHSPNLNNQMRELFGASIIDSTTNIYQGQAEPISTGYLSDNDWYACILTKSMKPFIFQNRQALKTEWNKSEEFMNRKWYYGADARYALGYGFPQLAIKVDNA
jgi:phage major head subunit gpT-like protein